tara:strand:- start:45 stop:1634 length:1590 start_codon:yes stop_codon:yes gene_type:complete
MPNWRVDPDEQDENNKEWRAGIVRQAGIDRLNRKRAIGTSDDEGRRWAGPDLGYQSQETFNKLKTEGYDGDTDYLRNFGWELRRFKQAAGPVLQSAVEKAAPALPYAAAAYQAAVPWHTRKSLEIGGKNFTKYAAPVLEQLERPITATSRALNIHPAVGNTGIEILAEIATPFISTTLAKRGPGIVNKVNKAIDAATLPYNGKRPSPASLQRSYSRDIRSKLGFQRNRLGAADAGMARALNPMDIFTPANLGNISPIEGVRREGLLLLKSIGNNRAFNVLLSDPLTGELGKRLMDLKANGKLTASAVVNSSVLAFNRSSLKHKLGRGFELHHADFAVGLMAEMLARANPTARARALGIQLSEYGKTFGDVYREGGFFSLTKYAHQVAHFNPLNQKIDFAGSQFKSLYNKITDLSSAEEVSDIITQVNTFVERSTQFATDTVAYQTYLQDYMKALPQDKLRDLMGQTWSLSTNPSLTDTMKFQQLWSNVGPEMAAKIKALANRQLKLDMIKELMENPAYLEHMKQLFSIQ